METYGVCLSSDCSQLETKYWFYVLTRGTLRFGARSGRLRRAGSLASLTDTAPSFGIVSRLKVVHGLKVLLRSEIVETRVVESTFGVPLNVPVGLKGSPSRDKASLGMLTGFCR